MCPCNGPSTVCPVSASSITTSYPQAAPIREPSGETATEKTQSLPFHSWTTAAISTAQQSTHYLNRLGRNSDSGASKAYCETRARAEPPCRCLTTEAPLSDSIVPGRLNDAGRLECAVRYRSSGQAVGSSPATEQGCRGRELKIGNPHGLERAEYIAACQTRGEWTYLETVQSTLITNRSAFNTRPRVPEFPGIISNRGAFVSTQWPRMNAPPSGEHGEDGLPSRRLIFADVMARMHPPDGSALFLTTVSTRSQG